MIERLIDVGLNLDVSRFQICMLAGVTTTLRDLAQQGDGRVA